MSDDRVPDPIPLETARAQLRHWWREPMAGFVSFATGTFDAWHFGKDGGLSGNIDELLVIGGIVLIAGTRRFIGSSEADTPPK